MLEEYRPSWSLFHNPHVQILMTFLIPQKTMKYKRELFALPDGGKVALDWALHAGELKEDAPIVVVLHGLTGSFLLLRIWKHYEKVAAKV